MKVASLRTVSLLGTAGILLYLTVLHATALPVACPDTGPIQCQTVLHSAGSQLLGLPLVVWGLLWTVSGFLPLWHLPGWRRLWIGLGSGGVLWGLGHEWALGLICLWCTAAQGLILLSGWLTARMVPSRAAS